MSWSFDQIQAALRAAGESTRLRLLHLCAVGEQTVGDLVEVLGQSQPRVSRHLKVLESAGLLTHEKEGRTRFYRVNLDKLQAVRDWLDWFDDESPTEPRPS